MIHLAQSDEVPTITSIVTDTFPNLRTGAIRDFLNIMKGHGYFKDARWNKTASTYEFETGSIIEFFSLKDDSEKGRGGRRDRLFVNECNRISFASFEELEVRTRELVYLDWNPTNEFWFHEHIQGKRDDVEFIILTFRDNEALDENTKKSILQRQNRRQWWLVYGLGQLGEVEGRIYKDWKVIDELPHDARLERRGIDFGYTNDPTAIVDLYKWNGGYIFDEVAYQKGLSNKQIFDIINELGKTLNIADSAEPKSIDELKLYGLTIMPAIKGKGSINQGIQFVQDQRIWVTARSVNLLKEYRNYLWEIDKDGKILNIPQDGFNHCMDAIRYAFSKYKSAIPKKEYQQPEYEGYSEFELRTRNENINNNIDTFSPNYRTVYEQPEWDS